jgi:Skp family chaperone for outer membrane proteins
LVSLVGLINEINKTNQKDQQNQWEDSMKRTGVISLIGAVALWLAMLSPALSDETFKVAVMNQQLVIEQSKAGKRAFEELKAYSMTRQKIINADDQELKELQLAIQDGKLSDSAKQEKQGQFQAKLDAYKRWRNTRRKCKRPRKPWERRTGSSR